MKKKVGANEVRLGGDREGGKQESEPGAASCPHNRRSRGRCRLGARE